MKTLSRIEAKSRFGEISEMVARGPLEVRKRNRVAFVAVSQEDYQRMAEMERRVRRRALDALRAAQDEADAKNLSEVEKAELMAELGLTYDG